MGSSSFQISQIANCLIHSAAAASQLQHSDHIAIPMVPSSTPSDNHAVGTSTFVLEVNPAERAVFTLDESINQPVLDLKIKNPTDRHQLYKVKCTNNDLFKIRPPLGIVKAGNEEVRITLTMLTKDKIPENDTQYFSIYCRETVDTVTAPRDQWKDNKEHGRKRLFVRFKKPEVPAPAATEAGAAAPTEQPPPAAGQD